MGDREPNFVVFPDHNWGPLAADPFAPLGPENSEIRSVLQRMWTRSGGDAALFDLLLPLDGPYGRPPKRPND